MATTLRTLAVTFACFATSVLDCAETQPLTSSDQKAVQEFFGVSESESGVLEVGGWRESGDSEGAPMQVFGYVSLIRPEMLLDRLCIVENRWGQGLIVEGKVEWVSELFKIDYEVWEPTTPGCVVSDRSALPKRISVKPDIDGPTLLRIIDGG